jgi:hypothetical protein
MAVRDSRNDMLPSDLLEGGGGPAEAASMISEAVAELLNCHAVIASICWRICSTWQSLKLTSTSAAAMAAGRFWLNNSGNGNQDLGLRLLQQASVASADLYFAEWQFIFAIHQSTECGSPA